MSDQPTVLQIANYLEIVHVRTLENSRMQLAEKRVHHSLRKAGPRDLINKLTNLSEKGGKKKTKKDS